MNYHVKEFYSVFSEDSARGNFHRVLQLHDAVDVDWKTIFRIAPTLTRGWFELSQLPIKDRIDFSHSYWMTKLPYHPQLHEFLELFFSSVDDVGVFVTQKKTDSPFDVHLVYSLKNDNGFFRGCTPADDEDISTLQEQFPEYLLPSDYVAFLKIHNGFWKTTDCTGIIKTTKIPETYKVLQDLLEQGENLLTVKEMQMDPRTLIPFYESFGMPYYQCFWAEWYPEQEMGNVYFSSATGTISDVRSPEIGFNTMAFPTFTDWLMFYLESVQ